LNPEIVLRLSLPEVNQLLAIVAKQPLDQVIDLFSKIKSQGDAAMAVAVAAAAPPTGLVPAALNGAEAASQ